MRAAGSPMSFLKRAAVIGEQYTSPAAKLRVSPATQSQIETKCILAVLPGYYPRPKLVGSLSQFSSVNLKNSLQMNITAR
jgi:hypothetical protein